MKKLITICAVVGLMLSAASVSWAVPTVTPPSTGNPSWWNSEAGVSYAYGYWSADILQGGSLISPPDNASHWASSPGFLDHNDFTASIGTENHTVSLDLDNVARRDAYKQIYIYITGTTLVGSEKPGATVMDTDNGTFDPMTSVGSIDGSQWSYLIYGEIHPQPDYVHLTVTVPGMTSVTNIWAGELCVPEPATMALLGLGALSLLRRKR